MLKELIDNYKGFHDALITEVHYRSNFDLGHYEKNKEEVDIFISCYNANRAYERDLIKITCIGLEYFQSKKPDRMIFGSLVKEEDGLITLDFFPIIDGIIEGECILSEDAHSLCIVKCSEVVYTVIQQGW